MIKYQLFSIIFSILLLPANLYCAFWLFREALNLTGMTFRDFLEKTSSQRPFSSIGRHRLRKKQRFFIKFFKQYSSDPKKSIQLLWAFGICTLPSLGALNIAAYAAMHIDKVKYAFLGDLILVVINAFLLIWGKIYRKKHPIDEELEAKKTQEKESREKKPLKHIIVYALVGIFFFGILLFFMLGIWGLSTSHSYQQPQKSAITVHADLITLLNEKGYETANIPTTFWEIDENKLLHTAAGVKGKSKFEFYGYSDDKTVDLVYNQIVYLTAPEIENSRRENYETTLSGGNKIFTVVKDGMHYLVMYQNDTVIYACSPNSLNEINEILTDLGYLKSKS